MFFKSESAGGHLKIQLAAPASNVSDPVGLGGALPRRICMSLGFPGAAPLGLGQALRDPARGGSCCEFLTHERKGEGRKLSAASWLPPHRSRCSDLIPLWAQTHPGVGTGLGALA